MFAVAAGDAGLAKGDGAEENGPCWKGEEVALELGAMVAGVEAAERGENGL